MFVSPCLRQNPREHLVRALRVAEGQHADFTVSADYTVRHGIVWETAAKNKA